MKKNLERIITALLLIVFLVGCAPAATPVPATSTAAPTATSTPTLTPIPPTPTSTPRPTATAEKKIEQLPVSFDQEIPQNLVPISRDSAPRIQALGIYPGTGIDTIRFSKNGQVLFAMNSEQITVSGLKTEQIFAQIPRGGVALGSSNAGNIFAVYQSQALHVFDLKGKELFSVPFKSREDNSYWTNVAVSPDGSLVAINSESEGAFEIFSIPDGKSVYKWDKKSLSLHGSQLQFSPDGKMISASYAAGIGIWKVGDWSKVNDFSAGYAGYFTPDDPNLLVIRGVQWGQPTDSFQVWKIAERKMVKKVDVKPGQWGFLIAPNSDTSGEIVLPHLIDDGSIRYSYLPPGRKGEAWSALHQPYVEFVTRFWEPALLVSNRYPPSSCWLYLNGKLECVQGKDIIVGSDRKVYVGTPGQGNGQIKLDLKDFQVPGNTTTLTGPFYQLDAAAIDPAHQLVFYSGWRDPNFATAIIENYRTGNRVKGWSGNGWITAPSYTLDGHYAAFFINQNPKEDLVLFDLEQGIIAYEELFSVATYRPVLSADGKQLAFVTWPGKDAQPDYVEIMAVERPNKKTRFNFELEKGIYPWSVAFSPDGSMLAVGFSDGMVRLVNIADGSIFHEWKAHADTVSALAFSEDSTILATCGRKGFIKFWGIVDQ